jgi:hypothetical protein
MIFRKEALAATELDGETVLLDVDTGAYYGYDATGSWIWELIVEPRTVGDLCRALVQRYDVEPQRCECEVIAFLEELAGYGLVGMETPSP